MWLAEIYDPLLFDFSDKKHHKKSGTEFSRAAHTSGDAMEVDTLTQEKIPKLTPEMKEQLKKKVDAAFVARSVISQRLAPKRLLFS